VGGLRRVDHADDFQFDPRRQAIEQTAAGAEQHGKRWWGPGTGVSTGMRAGGWPGLGWAGDGRGRVPAAAGGWPQVSRFMAEQLRWLA